MGWKFLEIKFILLSRVGGVLINGIVILVL